jgi:hypothetical protein
MDAKFDEKLKRTRRILFLEFPLFSMLLMCAFAYSGIFWHSVLIVVLVAFVLKNQERLDAINCDGCGTPVWKSMFYSRNGKCVGCCRDKDC